MLDKAIDAAGVGSSAPAAAPEKTFTVNLRNVPWKDAIAWYAEISGYTFVGDTRPTGSVSLTPPADRRFTLGEITDMLNEAMIQQKFILVRRQATFVIHPADEKIDPTFIPRIEVDDLKNRGKTELVEVEIFLSNLDAAATATEVQKLLTPFGSVPYAKGKRLVVQDTAGNISRIVQTLRAVEKEGCPEGVSQASGRC